MENEEELMTDTPEEEEIDGLDSEDTGVEDDELLDGEDVDFDEYDSGQDLNDGYGKDEFAKTLQDPDYYDKKDEELQQKLDEARAEEQEDYKNRGDENEKSDSENQNESESTDDNFNDSNKVDNNAVSKEKNDSNKVDNNAVSKEKNDSNKADNNAASKEKKDSNKADNKAVSKKKEGPQKKNQLDRLKDKKNVASAKMNQVRNKVDRAKAKAYQARHPVEAAKAKAKEKIKKKVNEVKRKVLKKILQFISKFPIPCAIVGLILVLLILGLLIFAGFASGSGSGSGESLDQYDYLKVQITNLEPDKDNKYFVDDYCLGRTFTYFFVNGHNDDIKVYDSNGNYDANATEEALKNAYAAYYISALTSTLKRGFSVIDREIEADKSIEYCDPYAGCMKSYYSGNIHNLPNYENDEEAEIVSFIERVDDSSLKYHNEAVILSDLMSSISRLIVVDKKYQNLLIVSSNNIKYSNMLDGNNIIEHANNRYNYSAILIALYTGVAIDSVDINTSDVIIYSNENLLETLSEGDFSGGDAGNYDFIFVDQGFYWPIGSFVKDCYEKDGVTMCDGDPAYTYITSRYTTYRPATGRPHLGIDISKGDYEYATSASVIAVNDGVVEVTRCGKAGSCTINGKVYNYNPGGCYVEIDHGNGIRTQYMHLPVGSFEVVPGQTVVRGQKLATVGNTGCSSGAHLHFAISVNGQNVNPLIYVSQTNPRSKGE